MKKAIALRHVAFEDLGLLGPILAGAGYEISYVEAPVEALDRWHLLAADLLVVLGGPIGVYETQTYPFLADEIGAVAARLEASKPVLGICLGAQIIAAAAGKRVYPSGVKELGWAPLSLTEAGRHSVLAPVKDHPVLHWHGDTFELPDGATLLASTAAVAHQAFALGDHALGLQFHIEAEARGLEAWFVGHACEISATPGIDVPLLRRQTADCAPALARVVPGIFRTWLAKLPA
jgi:GMP synthase (glutamine-hydrolysing)